MDGWFLWHPATHVIADGGKDPVAYPRPDFRNEIAEPPRVRRFHDIGLADIAAEGMEIRFGHPATFADFVLDATFGTLFVAPALWQQIERLIEPALVHPVEVSVRREKRKTPARYIAGDLLYRNVLEFHTDWSETRFRRADSYELRWYRDGEEDHVDFDPETLAFAGHEALADDRARQENWLKDYVADPWVLRGMDPVPLFHSSHSEFLMSPELVWALSGARATGWLARPALMTPEFR